MTGRLACCVPFCRRTCRGDKGYREFLCSNHWPTVSRHLRRRHSKLARIRKRRFGDTPHWQYKGGSKDRLQCWKLDKLEGKAWDACKVQAIERAVGI